MIFINYFLYRLGIIYDIIRIQVAHDLTRQDGPQRYQFNAGIYFDYMAVNPARLSAKNRDRETG